MSKLGTFAAGIAVGVTLIGGAVLVHQATTPAPDVTVMPCSAWADTQYPVIPANTFTDACLNDDGTFSTPSK